MTKQIPLLNGEIATVDDRDYADISQFNWNRAVYVYRNYKILGSRKNELLHRRIMNPPKGYVVDHIDGNPLNNQRDNLRICTQSQNSANKRKIRTDYKGVAWHKNRNYYIAQIKVSGKSFYLGKFESAVAAARVYDEKARELFGKFARLNFPRDGEQKA